MKNIFLMAYARKNLGDDLFLKMILDRYPNNHYYLKIENADFVSELESQYTNLTVLEGPDTDEELYKMNEEAYDGYIYIGGSIFMEGGKVYNLSEKFYDFVKRCQNKNIPFCYVSCNYGPFQTQEYFDLSVKNFNTCTNICFRDKYSYNLFKDIDNVRYAPDFAFTYPINSNDKIKDSVGISVIDLSIRKDLVNKKDEYIDILTNCIKEYIAQGKKVYLYSFCSYEGDERAINEILDRLDNNSRVGKVLFDGDVNKFLDMYSKMEYMICARFHAMILSVIAKQKIYVMSYSKKIDNVIKDLELDVPIMRFNELEKNKNIALLDFKDIDEEKINSIVNEAKNQELFIKKMLED